MEIYFYNFESLEIYLFVLAMLLKNYIAMGVITIVWTLIGGTLAFGHLVGGSAFEISGTTILGNLDYFGLRGIDGDGTET